MTVMPELRLCSWNWAVFSVFVLFISFTQMHCSCLHKAEMRLQLTENGWIHQTEKCMIILSVIARTWQWWIRHFLPLYRLKSSNYRYLSACNLIFVEKLQFKNPSQIKISLVTNWNKRRKTTTGKKRSEKSQNWRKMVDFGWNVDFGCGIPIKIVTHNYGPFQLHCLTGRMMRSK